MHSDDESPLTLTKWPFYISDALLVVLAITIGVLDNWKLDGIQIFACVLAVTLGAALLVMPFVTEYLMRVREENEDRASEDRLFKKQLENTEATLLKQQERLKQLESRSSLDDQRYELLTSAIDQKTQVEIPDITALAKRIETIETSGTKQAKVLDEFRTEITGFEKSFKETTNSLNTLKLQVDTLEKTNQESSSDLTKKAPDEVSADNASRKRSKKADSSLLQRAIQEKQDTASTAVSRIIDPNNQPSTSDRKTETADSSKPENEAEISEAETTDPKDTKVDTKMKVAAQEISSEIETLPEDFSVSLDANLMLDDDFFEGEGITEPKKSKPRKAKKSTTPETVAETATSETTTSENKEAATSSEKITATVVTVNKLMGIGNKPFLRGSGAGLSWEKGVEMEFQEIGKWTWSVPSDLSESFEIQVYCNDKDPDRKGKYTLTPGQQLEVVPEF